MVVTYLVLFTARGRATRVLWTLLATLLVLGVGLSRVYLGQHWLTDVFAGWLLGAVWALCVITAHRLWLRVRRRGAVIAGGPA